MSFWKKNPLKELSDKDLKDKVLELISDDKTCAEAIPYANEMIRRHPDGFLGYYQLGSAYTSSNSEKAYDAFVKAGEVAKDLGCLGLALQKQAYVLYDLGDYRESLNQYSFIMQKIESGSMEKDDLSMMMYALAARRMGFPVGNDKSIVLARLKAYVPEDSESQDVYDTLIDEFVNDVPLEESNFS